MMELRRLLLLTAVFTATVAAGAATAQTVIVTKAPPGATVELGLNAATIGTGKADPSGVATLPVNLAAHGSRAEADLRIFVDICDPTRRVTLIESGYEAAPPGAGCTRHEIFGVFYVKSVTTIVVSAGEQAQAVWIKQGQAPSEWLTDVQVAEKGEGGAVAEVPKGLVFFGGAGLTYYAHASNVSCGAYTACASENKKLAWRVGGDFWVRRWVGFAASYLKPLAATTDGSGTSFRFNSSLDVNVVTMTGKVGAPFGRFRVYGEAGLVYNWSKLSTTETIDDKTFTSEDGTTTVVPGGTQSFELKTDGWNWTWGGGGEYWFSKSAAIYGDVSWARLTGNASGGGEGSLNETLFSGFLGVRIRVGGKS